MSGGGRANLSDSLAYLGRRAAHLQARPEGERKLCRRAIAAVRVDVCQARERVARHGAAQLARAPAHGREDLVQRLLAQDVGVMQCQHAQRVEPFELLDPLRRFGVNHRGQLEQVGRRARRGVVGEERIGRREHWGAGKPRPTTRATSRRPGRGAAQRWHAPSTSHIASVGAPFIDASFSSTAAKVTRLMRVARRLMVLVAGGAPVSGVVCGNLCGEYRDAVLY